MAGAFSGHLLNSFETAQRASKGPFGQPLPCTPNISVQGAMSFMPQMHGIFTSPVSSSFLDSTLMDLSEETAKKIASLQAKLDKKLGPEYISQRPGPGGGPKLTYAEGWKIINLANEVFGFNGWSSNVVNMTTDYVDFNEQSQRFSVGVTAIVRVTLRDGVFHEDVGYGLLENSKSKGAALDKCKKEAVTDAVKRALRNFGNLLGNCLYDKSYTQEVVKMKVQPPKFDKGDLHRRPEFEDSNTRTGPSTSATNGTTNNPFTVATTSVPLVVKSEPMSRMDAILSACNESKQQAQSVTTAVQPHARSTSGPMITTATSTPNLKGKGAVNNVPAGPSVSRVETSDRNHSRQQRTTKASTSTVIQRSLVQQSNLTHPSLSPQGDCQAAFAAQSAANASASVDSTALPAVPRNEDVDIPDDESEFPFNSDDDAFLAEIDLGEEEIGRQIDNEEGTGVAHEADDSMQQPKQPPQPPQQGGYQARQPQLHRPLEQRVPNPPQLQHIIAGSPLIAQQPQVHSVTGVGRDARFASTSASDGSSALSSLGGFHFPSRLNPRNPQTTRAGQASTAVGGSSLGIKRTADAMQGHSGVPLRRPMQGMGLAQPSAVTPNNLSGQLPGGSAQSHRFTREPLGALDVGEGGDVKRIRR